MRQLISQATEDIYSEKSESISTLVSSLSGGKEGMEIIRAYIAIGVAARLAEPIKDGQVDDAVQRFQEAEDCVGTSDFDAILDIHKELAELHWLRRKSLILKGKLAYRNDEYSYEGTIYKSERDRRGPISFDLREKAKEFCVKLSALNREIEEHELQALKTSDEKAYRSYKEEIEVRSLQYETEAFEDREAETDVEKLTSALERRLKCIIHPDSSASEAAEAANGHVSQELFNSESTTLQDYQKIVSDFCDVVAEDRPLLGDCAVLPHSKKAILYAICWVREHLQTVGEKTDDTALRDKCHGLINTFNFLLTHLVNDWHDIAPEDKILVERLRQFDSFPDWALPLKAKYINEAKAAEEACEVTLQVISDMADKGIERS